MLDCEDRRPAGEKGHWRGFGAGIEVDVGWLCRAEKQQATTMEMAMRRSRTILAMMAMMLVVSACGNGEEPADPAEPDEDTEEAPEEDPETDDDPEEASLTIGFSQVTQASPFYVDLGQGAQDAAEELGHDMIFLDADGDETTQNNDVADLITQGVDALIINPVDPEAVAPALRDAEAAGIPVITVDRPVEGEGVVAHVGRDNVEMGRVVGEALAERLDDGAKVIEIQGDAGGIVMRDRRDGFNEALETAGDFEMVEGPYAEYIRAEAVTAMQDLLEAHPDVDAVYAHNDDMAMGALQVLQDAGNDEALVAGVDGLMEALEAMDEGDQYVATALNDPVYLGQLTVDAAVAAAQGEDVPEEIDAGTQAVTPENVAEFVGDTTFGAYEPEMDF